MNCDLVMPSGIDSTIELLSTWFSQSCAGRGRGETKNTGLWAFSSFPSVSTVYSVEAIARTEGWCGKVIDSCARSGKIRDWQISGDENSIDLPTPAGAGTPIGNRSKGFVFTRCTPHVDQNV